MEEEAKLKKKMARHSQFSIWPLPFGASPCLCLCFQQQQQQQQRRSAFSNRFFAAGKVSKVFSGNFSRCFAAAAAL